MEQKVLKLSGEQVDEITLIDSNLPYKTGQRKERGETYNRYRFNGIVFTVNTTNPFVEQHANGTVDSVKLLEGQREVDALDDQGNEVKQVVNTLTFDSSTNYAQAENRAFHKAKMNAIAKSADRDLSADEFNKLIAASVA